MVKVTRNAKSRQRRDGGLDVRAGITLTLPTTLIVRAARRAKEAGISRSRFLTEILEQSKELQPVEKSQ